MLRFTEDDIRRSDLPEDVMGLLHDLCYHVNNNLRGKLDSKAVDNYVRRAQGILKTKSGGYGNRPARGKYVKHGTVQHPKVSP